MLNIYKIPVPTPYPVGPVNSYLVKNQPYTLIDPGPDTPEAQQGLMAGLISLGVDVKDISRVVLTHGHPDHSGLARWVVENSGAQIYAHQFELYKLTPEHDFYLERLPFFQEAGLPSKVLREILNDFDPAEKPMLLPEAGATALSGGEVFEFAGGALVALHLPGHSYGHVCLFDEAASRLICGDFILKRITPNPHLEPDPGNFARRLPTLKQYLDGLEFLENLCPRLVLPGHGENIDNSAEIIKQAKGHHRERLQVIEETLENKNINIYQLTRLCYPHIKGFQIYLGLSEVFAHVDYLLGEGRIVKEAKSGVSYFKNAS